MKYYFFVYIILVNCLLLNAQNNTLHFDGNDDYVNLNSISGSMESLTEFTIEFWVKFDINDNTDYGAFFSVNDNNNGNVFLIRLANSSFDSVSDAAIVYINDNGNQYIEGDSPIGDGLCHHIAFTYNNGVCKLYVDGALEASENHTIAFSPGDKYSLGQEYDNLTNPISNLYNGELSKFRIWNVEKTQSEVSNLMNLVPSLGTLGLLTHYKFEDGIGNMNNTGITVCTNEVIGGGNGLLNNFSLSGNISNYITNTCDLDYHYLNVDTQICSAPYISNFGNSYTSSGIYYDTILSSVQDTIFQLTLDVLSESMNTLVMDNGNGSLTSLDSVSTYQWLNCNESFSSISGETNQSYTPSNAGYYAVELTYNGCVDTSECIQIKGIGLSENANEVRIYPNPSKGLITINGLQENEEYRIRVRSQLGVLIKEIYNSSPTFKIDLPELKGCYFIEIQNVNKEERKIYPIVFE